MEMCVFVRMCVCVFVKLGYLHTGVHADKRALSGTLWRTKLLCLTTDTVSWTEVLKCATIPRHCRDASTVCCWLTDQSDQASLSNHPVKAMTNYLLGTFVLNCKRQTFLRLFKDNHRLHLDVSGKTVQVKIQIVGGAWQKIWSWWSFSVQRTPVFFVYFFLFCFSFSSINILKGPF